MPTEPGALIEWNANRRQVHLESHLARIEANMETMASQVNRLNGLVNDLVGALSDASLKARCDSPLTAACQFCGHRAGEFHATASSAS